MIPRSTPGWILDFLATTPHGGWIHPIALTQEHPLVVGDWSCWFCARGFEPAGGYAIMMPFQSESWWALHRTCSMQMMGLEDGPQEVPDSKSPVDTVSGNG